MELTETGLPKSYKEQQLIKRGKEAKKLVEHYEKRLKHHKGDKFDIDLLEKVRERYQDIRQEYLDFKMQN